MYTSFKMSCDYYIAHMQAEQWVNTMSKLDGDDKSNKIKSEGRPPR